MIFLNSSVSVLHWKTERNQLNWTPLKNIVQLRCLIERFQILKQDPYAWHVYKLCTTGWRQVNKQAKEQMYTLFFILPSITPTVLCRFFTWVTFIV